VTLWDDAKVLVEKRSSNEPWLGLHLNFYRVVIMTMNVIGCGSTRLCVQQRRRLCC
jgi:hypothetical protein